MSFNMYVPTNILFDAGELNQLYKQVMPGRKALLVISNGITGFVPMNLKSSLSMLKTRWDSYSLVIVWSSVLRIV